MSPDVGWEVAKKLFHEALDLEPHEREPFLQRACAGAPALLDEVRSLLHWVAETDEFLETPAVRVGDLIPEVLGTDLMVGQSLGPWRIVSIIGHGGMGTVYRAERADAAFRRVAAVKVVRRGAHLGDVLERFHRERETLAALDHPNIARLIDGGTTVDGQPYFVMEHVDGVRVDRYCDAGRLTIDQRLALFRTICSAVQYAHRGLVVHRDLKPDNILVSHEGVAKLLDFGIARVLSDKPTRAEHDALAAATWMLTPDYASPEQISGGALTTAADVYSLGVLLYVLLTGRPPYRLQVGTHAAMGDQLATAAVPPPSHAFALPDARERSAERRSTPRALVKRLAGDLDAIVLRALARDVPDRYQSVDQLIDELDRHVAQRPVAARGTDWWYLASALARRHRLAMTAAAAFAIVTTVGIAAVLWQASIAADARARAERRFEDVRHLARSFIFDVDAEIVNVPGTTRARALMMRTASDYLEGLAREAYGDRGLQRELASAFVKVGDAQGHPTSANVGDTAGARASYERAIEISSAVLSADPRDVDSERTRAMAHRRLSDVLAWAGDTSAALTHCETSQRLFAAVASLSGATAEDRLQVAVAELKVGDLLGNPNLPNLRRPQDASAKYEATLASMRTLAALTPDDPRVERYLGLVLERLGTMHEVGRDWNAAADAYGESFEIRQRLAASSPEQQEVQRDLAIAYEKLGNVQLALGQVAAAEASYRGALSEFERMAKADSSNVVAARSVAISREKVAGTIAAQGQRANSVSLLESALLTHQRIAAGDPDNAQARCDAARLQDAIGDTWAPATAQATPPACGYWRQSLTTRQHLVASRVTCTTGEEVAQLTAKLKRCR